MLWDGILLQSRREVDHKFTTKQGYENASHEVKQQNWNFRENNAIKKGGYPFLIQKGTIL